MQLGTLARQVAQEIKAGAGVEAFTDYRDAQLPGVMVMPASIDFDRLDGTTATITWTLVLLAGGAGADDALDAAGDLLTKVNAAFAIAGPVEAITVSNPNLSGDPIPALTVSLITDSEE